MLLQRCFNQKVNEGGQSRNAGRARQMEFFNKIADIDRKQYKLATVGEAKAQQRIQLGTQAMETNRERDNWYGTTIWYAYYVTSKR